MKKLVLASALALALVAPATGCHPRMLGAAIVAGAILGTVAIMAAHDAHMHSEYCGHHRQWHSGRWVYHYHDHWEYYDDGTGQWYYYQE